jgi:hypothetical protein
LDVFDRFVKQFSSARLRYEASVAEYAFHKGFSLPKHFFHTPGLPRLQDEGGHQVAHR